CSRAYASDRVPRGFAVKADPAADAAPVAEDGESIRVGADEVALDQVGGCPTPRDRQPIILIAREDVRGAGRRPADRVAGRPAENVYAVIAVGQRTRPARV